MFSLTVYDVDIYFYGYLSVRALEMLKTKRTPESHAKYFFFGEC